MRREGKLWRLMALLLALAMLLSSTGAALAEAMAVEEAQPAEVVVAEAVEEAQPAQDEVVEEVADAPEVEAGEEAAQPSGEPEDEAVEELPTEEASDAPAGEPAEDEAEPPLIAEEDAESEPDAPAATLAVVVEPGEGTELRALIQAEGLVFAPAYRWQFVENAAYAEAISNGADAEALWADIEGADGEALDAAAAMGEAYADFIYRCIVQSGEMVAVSEAYRFAPSAESSEAEEQSLVEELLAEAAAVPECDEYDHVWNYDAGTRKSTCEVCGAVCDHADTQEIKFVPDLSEDPRAEYCDSQYHIVYTDEYCYTRCYRCQAELKCELIYENVAVKQRHMYYDNEADVELDACSVCGFPCPDVDSCDHDITAKYIKDEWDHFDSYTYTYIDDRTHKVEGDLTIETVCEICYEVIEEEPATEFIEAHSWDSEETGYCSLCERKNECAHAHKRPAADGIELQVVYKDVGDPSYHMKYTVGNMLECADCGAPLQDDYGVQNTSEEKEQHDFTNGDICEICGAKCAHGKTFKYLEASEASSAEYYDEYYHIVYTDLDEVTECSYCGEEISREAGKQKNVGRLEWHNYDAEDENGDWQESDECTECGCPKEICDHENKEYLIVSYRDDYTYERVDALTHRVTGDEIGVMVTCKDCGKWVDDLWETEWVEAHRWETRGEEVVCRDCGEKNTCEHPSSHLDSEGWASADYYEQNDATTHIAHHFGNAWICDVCGQSIRGGFGEEFVDEPTTEPHEFFNGSDICIKCGAKCAHGKTFKYLEVSNRSGAEPYNDRFHISYVDLDEVTECSYCGEEISRMVGAQKNVRRLDWHNFETEEEDGEWQETDTCTECGSPKEPCAHENIEYEIVSPRRGYTYERVDALTHRVTGEEICVMPLCQDCGEWLDDLWETEWVEAHRWEVRGTEVVCKDCGTKNNCEHPKSHLAAEGIGSADYYEQKDESTHILHNFGNARICDNCGQFLSGGLGEEFEDEPTTEPHEFPGDAQTCIKCGAPKPEKLPVQVTEITLSQTTAKLKKGESLELTATVAPKTATNQELRWSSDKQEVATVEGGIVLAVGPGKAEITCTATDGSNVSASCTITVPATEVTEIQLSDETLSLEKGGSATLTATVLPENADNPAVNWTTNNEGVATVDGGEVKAVGPGQAKITCAATDGSGVKAVCTVTVTDPDAKLECPAELTLGVGETQTPAVKSAVEEGFTYDFGDGAVVTVSAKGVFKGVAEGDATVKVTGKVSGASAQIAVHVKKAPDSVTLDVTNRTLGKGETLELTATLPEGTASVLTADTSDKKIAKVAAVEGEPNKFIVTATGTSGTAKITVKAFNGQKATCKVTVKKAPAAGKLSIDPAQLTIPEGAQEQLKVKYKSGFGGGCTWSVEEQDGAATIERDGTLTAAKAGKVKVVATTYNGVRAECEVTIEPAPETVELDETQTELGVGETLTLSAVAKDASGDAVKSAKFDYQIECEPENAVTVNQTTGVLTAKKAGTATVTVKTHNDKSASRTFTVKAAPTKVSITNNPKTLGKEEPWTLETAISAKDKKGNALDCAGAVTFTSSDKNVLTVDKTTGVLTAKKAGSAKITAKTYNGKTASVTITVKAAPTALNLKLNGNALGEEAQKLGVKETATLTASFGKTNQYGHVSWENSAPDIVSVTEVKGKNEIALEALAEGEATITASVYNKENPEEPLTASCKIEVKAAPTEENTHLAPKKVQIGVDESVATDLIFTEAAGAVKGYKSSNKNVATVSAKGVIKGVKKGTSTITATMYNDVKITVDIEVVKAPKSLTITNVPEGNTMKVGETWTPEFEIGGYGGADKAGVVKTYTSSDQKKASFKDGVLTALKPGRIKITCKTYNGKASKTYTITVVAADAEP